MPERNQRPNAYLISLTVRLAFVARFDAQTDALGRVGVDSPQRNVAKLRNAVWPALGVDPRNILEA